MHLIYLQMDSAVVQHLTKIALLFGVYVSA